MGRLLGIARRSAPRAPMEVVSEAWATTMTGVADDYRGRWKPGGKNRRQVSFLMREDWEAALAELGGEPIAWHLRRCNLFVGGIDLPRMAGTEVRVGDAVFELTVECDPCKRMDEVRPGLFKALMPEWRGGRLARVVRDGRVRTGDMVELA